MVMSVVQAVEMGIRYFFDIFEIFWRAETISYVDVFVWVLPCMIL